MHRWDLARATGLDERLDPAICAEMLAGMEPLDDVLRSSGQYGRGSSVPRRRRRGDEAAGIHRPNALTPPRGGRGEPAWVVDRQPAARRTEHHIGSGPINGTRFHRSSAVPPTLASTVKRCGVSISRTSATKREGSTQPPLATTGSRHPPAIIDDSPPLAVTDGDAAEPLVVVSERQGVPAGRRLDRHPGVLGRQVRRGRAVEVEPIGRSLAADRTGGGRVAEPGEAGRVRRRRHRRAVARSTAGTTNSHTASRVACMSATSDVMAITIDRAGSVIVDRPNAPSPWKPSRWSQYEKP